MLSLLRLRSFTVRAGNVDEEDAAKSGPPTPASTAGITNFNVKVGEAYNRTGSSPRRSEPETRERQKPENARNQRTPEPENPTREPSEPENPNPENQRTQEPENYLRSTLVPRIFCALSVLRKLGMIWSINSKYELSAGTVCCAGYRRSSRNVSE